MMLKRLVPDRWSLKGVPICKEAENRLCMPSGYWHASQFFTEDEEQYLQSTGPQGNSRGESKVIGTCKYINVEL